MAAFISNQLQPLKAITHNLPAVVSEPAVSLIGQVSPPAEPDSSPRRPSS